MTFYCGLAISRYSNTGIRRNLEKKRMSYNNIPFTVLTWFRYQNGSGSDKLREPLKTPNPPKVIAYPNELTKDVSNDYYLLPQSAGTLYEDDIIR
ncbi:MAG: hypothetical protein LBV41_10215, partial [Cytophagaceae bacterium]|nr:hypothetical protein [Cytophagaceae bacterium]